MKKWAWMVCGAALLMGSVATHADDKKPGKEREMLRRAQQQLQQVQQQMAAQKEQLDKVQQAHDADQKAIDASQAKARAASTQAGQLQAALDQANSALQARQAELAAMEKRLADTSAKLALTERDLAQKSDQVVRMQKELSSRTAELNTCGTHNTALYQAGRGLIAQCNARTVSGPALSFEAASGQRRVELENALEQVRDQLDDHRFAPTTATR